MAARSSGESLTALRWLTIPHTTCNRSTILSNGSTKAGHVGCTLLSSSNKSASCNRISRKPRWDTYRSPRHKTEAPQTCARERARGGGGEKQEIVRVSREASGSPGRRPLPGQHQREERQSPGEGGWNRGALHRRPMPARASQQPQPSKCGASQRSRSRRRRERWICVCRRGRRRRTRTKARRAGICVTAREPKAHAVMTTGRLARRTGSASPRPAMARGSSRPWPPACW